MNYHRQKVEIVINKDDDLYKRIVKVAEREGTTVEVVVDTLMMLGSHPIMRDKLKLIEGRER